MAEGCPPRTVAALVVSLVSAAALLLVAAGCDDTGPAPDRSPGDVSDAGAPDAGSDASALPPDPEPPRPPAEVRLADWTCPEGWLTVPVGEGEAWGFSACEPPPRVACSGAEVQGVADSACRPVGPPCPEGDEPFPAEAGLRRLAEGFEGAVVHVLPGADAGGDGSREAPFATVAAALAEAEAGTVVALGRGELTERVVLEGRLALVGACAAATRLVAPAPDDLSPAVTVRGGDGTLVAALTVTGETTGIGVEDGARQVAIRGVLVDGAVGTGIWVTDGSPSALLEDVVVRDTRAWPDGIGGGGLYVGGGARVELRGVVIEDNRDVALWATHDDAARGTLVTGEDVVLTGTRGSEHGGGWGISAALGAVVRLSRVLVSGHDVTPAVVGESFSDLGGELELVDAVLRDSGTAEGTRTLGLEVLDGARLALTRALVERLGSSGAHVTGDTGEQRARLELTDVVLRDPVQVGAQPTYGVHSSGSVDLLFRRVAVLRAAQAGVALFAWFAELGASLEAEDLVVAQTVPPPDEEAPEFGWGGYGLELGGQPRVTLRRVLVDESGEIGLVLNGIDEVGSRLEAELSDLVVTSTAAGHDLGLGWGVDVHSGARATFERVRLEGNHDSGLVVRGNEDLSVPTEVVARDLLVRGTRSRRLQPYAGRGVSVQGRASLTAQRVLVDGNREYGIVVLGMPGAPDTQLDLTGVTIRDTRPAACTQEPRESERSCFDERGNALGGGGGLAVSQGGTARLAGFSLTGCETVGLFLAPDASVRLEHGRIEGNGIGVNALVEDVTAALVVDDVFIFGNGIDVARRELPLPRPLVRP